MENHDLSDVIAEIEVLFSLISEWDPLFGFNGRTPEGYRLFQGWQHPALVTWSRSRGKDDPRHDLDGPELFVLLASLNKKMSKRGAVTPSLREVV